MYTPILKQFSRPDVVQIDDWRGGLLIRSTNWLGDALMTLPAIYQLRRVLPAGIPFSILCPANLKPMWEACPFVDNVVSMAQKRIVGDEVATVRRLDPGATLVLPNSFGSALDAYKLKTPYRLGRRGRMRAWLLTHTIKEWSRGENIGVCHQLSYYLELVSMLGEVEYSASCEPMTANPDLAVQLGMDGDAPWIALAPGAAYGPAKQWSPKSFHRVAEEAIQKGWRVVVVGGPGDKNAAEETAKDLKGVLNLAGKTNLAQLISVLAKSDFVLSNDSGSMHLAAALGRPGLAIFGSTDPIATGPVGGSWDLAISEESCRPCFKRTCPRGDAPYACLESITPEHVISRLPFATS